MFSLTEEDAARGVVTHSSGNHGAALAYAAQQRGIPAYVVMPENAPKIKMANVARFGATIHLCAPTLAAREQACAELARDDRRDAHPSLRRRARDRGTGHGRARACSRTMPDLDVIIAPVGGGGLLSGTAIAAAA